MTLSLCHYTGLAVLPWLPVGRPQEKGEEGGEQNENHARHCQRGPGHIAIERTRTHSYREDQDT